MYHTLFPGVGSDFSVKKEEREGHSASFLFLPIPQPGSWPHLQPCLLVLKNCDLFSSANNISFSYYCLLTARAQISPSQSWPSPFRWPAVL